MNCEKIMSKLLEIGDYSHIPLKIKLHLLLCPKCRRESAILLHSFNSMKADAPYCAPSWIEKSIIAKIEKQNASGYSNISPFKWIASSSIIFASIILVNYSNTFIDINKEFGKSFSIPMAIVMGSAITSYLAILVGCNYEAIIKAINKYRHIILK